MRTLLLLVAMGCGPGLDSTVGLNRSPDGAGDVADGGQEIADVAESLGFDTSADANPLDPCDDSASDEAIILASGLVHPYHLAAAGGYIYWTTHGAGPDEG